MKPRPVLIEWSDSCHWSSTSWVDLDGLETSPCDVVTVGWLIAKDATCLTVAHSITEAQDATGVFVIPRACVKRLDRL